MSQYEITCILWHFVLNGNKKSRVVAKNMVNRVTRNTHIFLPNLEAVYLDPSWGRNEN